MLYGAILWALALAGGVSARDEKRTGPPSRPSCVDFTAFVYAGCFKDYTSPRTLLYRSDLDFAAMTVEKCVAFCKGNNYRYAGLEYYGECWCGATVSGAQTEESQCNFPCNGNQTEICGGNNALSIYQDPTFPIVDPRSMSDYKPMGCYSEGSNGRTLAWRQADVGKTNLTVQTCLHACKLGAYPFGGVEYGQECYCGVVLGNGTVPLDSTKCNMKCTGDDSQFCGGRSTLNLYVAEDLESREPCVPDRPGSNSPSSTALSITTVKSLSLTVSVVRTSSSLTSRLTPINPSTSDTIPSGSSILGSSTPSLSLFTRPITQTSSSGVGSSISISGRPSTSTSDTFLTTTKSESSSGPSAGGSSSTSKPPQSSDFPMITSKTPSFPISTKIVTSTPTFSSSSSILGLPSSISNTAQSTDPNHTSSTGSNSSSSSSIIPSSLETASEATLPPSSQSSKSSSSTSYTSSSNSISSNARSTPRTTSTESKCNTTITVYPAPTCECKLGKWCATELPQFGNYISCLKSFTTCITQLASCFKNAGYPLNLQCDKFDGYCSRLHSYCGRKCTSSDCSLPDFRNSFSMGEGQGEPKFLTSIYPCQATSTSALSTTTTETPTTKTETLPPLYPTSIPPYSNICTQPDNPANGYGYYTPVGNVKLPFLACNNEQSDYDTGRPFKLYLFQDKSKCPSYQRSGDYGPSQGCRDACREQYNTCVNSYAENCRDYDKTKVKRGGRDDYSSALKRCKDQRDDCFSVNSGVKGEQRCEKFSAESY